MAIAHAAVNARRPPRGQGCRREGQGRVQWTRLQSLLEGRSPGRPLGGGQPGRSDRRPAVFPGFPAGCCQRLHVLGVAGTCGPRQHSGRMLTGPPEATGVLLLSPGHQLVEVESLASLTRAILSCPHFLNCCQICIT